MKKTLFTGAGVAIITPFDDAGNINFDELGKIIDNQIHGRYYYHGDNRRICHFDGRRTQSRHKICR